MNFPQDHHSSDSFYDSDYAEGEPVTGATERTERDSEESYRDESQEVDGEWGRR